MIPERLVLFALRSRREAIVAAIVARGQENPPTEDAADPTPQTDSDR
jgi:hypothetical protein